ncbi:MAG TPA: hypothetical protein VH417_18530 [Vicinamibacterales bacterium]|jgi:hypothetical protein
MNRVRIAAAATLVSTIMYAGAALAAQATTTTPSSSAPLQPVLAGKKIVPPVRGEASVEFTQPTTKAIQGQNKVQTTIKVRNNSAAPIARLQITETWYDKGGAIVAGGKGVINGLLQPGEIQTITIETPYNPKMSSNAWNFSHANGTVKTSKVKALDDKNAAASTTTAKTGAKEPAAKPATTAKK